MSVVYLARQVALNRLVALKVIRARVYADPEVAARFRDEAEAAARFQHPNIIQVYEVGESEGQGYLVLEYASGGSLQQKLAGNPQPPRERRAAHRVPGPGPPLRPPARDRPPRPEAGERRLDGGRDSQGHRLRPGQADGARGGPDPDRRHHGDAQLHGPGAGARHARRRHRRRRHLRPGRHPLRDAHRTPAVQGLDPAFHPQPGRRAGGPAAGPAAASSAPRDRDDLPEMPRERPPQAVRQRPGPGRRPAPVPRRSADRGPADQPGGVALALVPARAGQGRAGRRTAARRHRGLPGRGRPEATRRGEGRGRGRASAQAERAEGEGPGQPLLQPARPGPTGVAAQQHLGGPPAPGAVRSAPPRLGMALPATPSTIPSS